MNEAARILAISLVRRLGYHDSNMTGLAQNHTPQVFWAQPIEVLVSTLVGVIRETRPHVVVTYDAFGNTGHLDHIQAHRVTMLAVGAVFEARCFSTTGPIWNVRQVFHPVYPVSALWQFLDDRWAGRHASLRTPRG